MTEKVSSVFFLQPLRHFGFEKFNDHELWCIPCLWFEGLTSDEIEWIVNSTTKNIVEVLIGKLPFLPTLKVTIYASGRKEIKILSTPLQILE